MEEHSALLYDESQKLCITVWFLGYSSEEVQDFILKKYAGDKFWKQYKLIS